MAIPAKFAFVVKLAVFVFVLSIQNGLAEVNFTTSASPVNSTSSASPEVNFTTSASPVNSTPSPSPVQTCSKERPCQNFGTCQKDVKSYNCKCVPGYNGELCEKKYTEQRVCGNSSFSVIGINNESKAFIEPLKIILCNGTCASANYSFRHDSGANGTSFARFCVNSSSCNNVFEYLKQEVKKKNLTVLAGNASCCSGDLCNIRNGTDIPQPTTQQPVTPVYTTPAPRRCYQTAYLTNPLFSVANEYLGQCTSDSVCVYLRGNTSAPSPDLSSIKIPSDLINKTRVYDYVLHGCVDKKECADYCETIKAKNKGVLLNCSRECCSEDYCNTGDSVKTCSKERPCQNFGTCQKIVNSTFCKCVLGYYGELCEKKYIDLSICGKSSYVVERRRNTTTTVSSPLKVIVCKGTCGHGSYSIVQYSKGFNNTYAVSGQFCFNSSWCDNILESVSQYLESIIDVNRRVLAVNGSCCSGDLCNIPNGTDIPRPTAQPVTPRTVSTPGTPSTSVVTPVTPASFCVFKPCKNGGNCTEVPNDHNSYVCSCQDGYQGKRCEEESCSSRNLYDYDNATQMAMPSRSWHAYRCEKSTIPGNGIYFYGRKHSHIYICRNGVIQFDMPYSLYWPTKFGIRSWLKYYAIIAPFWSKVDMFKPFNNNPFQYKGQQFKADPDSMSRVYHQVYNDQSSLVLTQASNDVRKYTNNSQYKDFNASVVIVVTWKNLYPSRYYNYYSAPYYELSNTFQAVLITDGLSAFVLFNYPCKGIQWVVPAAGSNWRNDWYRSYGLPVAGYNSGSGFRNRFSSIPGSSTLDIIDVDDKPGNAGITGRWFFPLSDGPTNKREAELKCKAWNNLQTNPNVNDFQNRVALTSPCPCTRLQAWRDGRFRFDWRQYVNYRPQGVYCWISREMFVWSTGGNIKITVPKSNVVKQVSTTVAQRCCYSINNDRNAGFGSLVLGPTYGGHLKVNFFQQFKWLLPDDEAHRVCCVDTNLCHLFYEKRPSDECKGYQPPRRRWFWGDPHIVTLDNKNYTFNGLGEYIMVDVDGGNFQLQARTKKAPGDVATEFSAAAAKEQTTSEVEVRLDGKGGLEVLVAGKAFNVSTENISQPQEIDNITLSREANKTDITATFPSGISVVFGAVKGMMVIVFSAPEEYKNKTKGLLGVWNDNMDDDLTLRNGTVIPISSDDRTIHQFGLDWQITVDETLFTYKPGEGVDTYKNTSYTPLFADEIIRKFENSTIYQKALAVCGSNLVCLYDALATNNTAIGEASLKTSKKLENETKQLENFPPEVVNAPMTINMTINKMATIVLTAKDKNNDNIEFIVPPLPGLQANKTENKLTLNWKITSADKVNFTVVLKDPEGASSTWSPTIVLCACHQNGTCTKVVDQSGDRFQVMPCQCDSGYTGRYCESDIDGCAGSPCYLGVKCKDLPPPNGLNGFECGPCPAGYAGDGQQCTDIDECLPGNHSCQHRCINTPGSYRCECDAGFRLKEDKHNCTDIDECLKPVCQDNCTNTIGSYKCVCKEGFNISASDPSKCVPTDGCNKTIAGCQQVCYKLNGDDKCSCNKGYKLENDGKMCKNIDECKLNPCGQNSTCVDNEGSYECKCHPGYKLMADKSTCEDINECIDGSLYNCTDDQKCVNIPGSYKCDCANGLELKDGKCQEKQEEPPTTAPTTLATTTQVPTRKPDEAEKRQSVLIRILNMKLTEWTVQIHIKFKMLFATLATDYCKGKKTICGIPESKRKRRAVGDPVYTADNVHLLPGFPKENGTDLLVAFYVLNPSSNGSAPAIPVLVLMEIVNNSRAQIEVVIGNKTIGEIKSMFAPSTPTPTPPPTIPTPSETWKWIVIGACCAVFVLIVIIVIIVICIRKQKNNKRARIAIGDPNEAYHDDEL